MNRFLYTLVLYVFLPFVPIKLIWRGIKQPEYRQHWRERFGFYSQTVKKPIIWLHCVSVGETRAALPLVNALLDQYPHHQILLSHTTPTGRDTSTQLFGDRVQRVYLPYDLPFAVNRFIRHFKPCIGVLMETELWFNLIATCRQQKIALLLVNARLSEKSAQGYAKLGKLAREGLQNLTAIAAQTEQDAARLRQLGAHNVQVVGNIKFDVAPPENAILQGQALRHLWGDQRPVFLAASTREGEESIILEAINQANIPHLVTIIVPRHPQRFYDVEIMLQQRGLHYQKRSTLNQAINAETQVILGDSMGELFAYYASADVCLVGGSLQPFGGQNLIEPMRMGKPVLIGEHTFNFKEVAELAVAQSAAWRVQDSQTISQALHMLFENPHKQVEMGEKGLVLCMASQGATQKTLDIIAQRINAIT
ncbi:MAG TPA: lipid IV(A) 3-deoxy-D-manno-octulosonic acid transferase [Methylotenera sp.]|nr:lipid IV(A) 3-deoxy-D-manno-octulosonic acid transferase [Methylotenera sp.]HPH04563.1 lipid IV(A) 3-deoxy-D-manno-octulosonic acid transferase [Methylotenera sp.]HPN00762.1 lipid IV(A) 3-deoxy-D-manno-octulosonic acid transferase [Methylotenera sp.]